MSPAGMRNIGILAATFAALAAPARAGDFMDTRLTWTFGDDDFLSDAGESLPDSPLPSIGDRSGYELFMDNIDSRYTGRENQTHLVMYKMVDGFFDRLTTDAAVVIQFDISQSDLGISDDGSYIRIRYGLDDRSEAAGGDGIAVIFFPFDTERFRLGYLWDISWGGGGIFTNKRNGFAPGLKLQLDLGDFVVFAGFKTARVSQLEPDQSGAEGEPANVQQTNYGGLAGVGWDATPWLRVDLGGGFFEQGTFDQPGLEGEGVYTFGGSLRIAFHDGMDVGMSADFRLYRNEPMGYESLAAEADAAAAEADAADETGAPLGGFGWMLSLEGAVLGQHLADATAAGTTGASSIQPAYAAALQGVVRYGGFKASLTGFLRNVEFILHNVPSFSPFVAIPGEVTTDPQFFAALGVEFFFDGPRLTPALTAGIQLPAAITSPGELGSAPTTIVVRDEENRDILPPGEAAVAVVSARLSLRWDLSDILSVYGMIQYEHDENATRLTRDADGTFRTYRRFDRLGAMLITQARF